MPGGGFIVQQQFRQIFTANGSWTAPGSLAFPPLAYCWGPGGSGGNGVGGAQSGGGGGGGAFGGEPGLGGVAPGTVLTITVPAGGSGSQTTITGGSVTVAANAGGNGSGTGAGTGGTAGTNTRAHAGGNGGIGAVATTDGGGGGGSAGASGNGGTGATGAAGGGGGTAGSGTSGQFTGAIGGAGGTASAPGSNGIVPGSGAGGGGQTSGQTAGGTGAGGQAEMVWQIFAIIPAQPIRRVLARGRAVGGTGSPTPAAPGSPFAQQPAGPRPRGPRRGQSASGPGSTAPPSTTPGTAFAQQPAGPRPRGPRRGQAVSSAGTRAPVGTAPRQQPARPRPRARARSPLLPPRFIGAQPAPAGGARIIIVTPDERPWLKRRRSKWYRHGPALDSFYGAEIPAGVGAAYVAGWGLAASTGPDEAIAAVAAPVPVDAALSDASRLTDRRVRRRPNLRERLRGSNRPGRPVWTRDAVVPATGRAFDEQRSERLVNSYRLPRPSWRGTSEYPLPVVQRRK